MRLAITSIVLTVVLSLGIALAAEQATLDCLKAPGCCEFTCITLDLTCCGCGQAAAPLTVEFLGCKADVLGTATVTGDWCCGLSTATTDKPVNTNDVYSIRLTNGDDNTVITWAAIWVNCQTCGCGKLKKIFKGDIYCWQPLAKVAEVPAV
jgi:hypothetical protein